MVDRLRARGCVAFAALALPAPACAPRSSHDALIARCGEALSGPGEPSERLRAAIVEDCWLGVVEEPTCRDAFARSLTADPAVVASMVASACAAGYCPRLAEPRPAICERGIEGVSASELGSLFAPLMQRVLVLELGETDAMQLLSYLHVAAEEKAIALAAQLSRPIPLEPALPDPALPAVDLTLEGDEVVVIAGGRRFPIDPATGDFGPVAVSVAASGTTTAIIRTPEEMPYEHIRRLFQALTEHGVADVHFQVMFRPAGSTP